MIKGIIRTGLFALMLFLMAGCTSGIVQKKPEPAYRMADERGFIWHLVSRGAHPGEQAPSAGEDGQMAYDSRGHRFVLFGGKNDDDLNVNETWFYYPAKKQWVPMKSSKLNPPPKEDHVLLYDSRRNRVILHGGENGDTSNDLWELNLETLQWQDKTSAASPFLEDHAAVYVAAHKGAYFFGGQDEQHPALKKLLFLNLDENSPDFYTWKEIEAVGKKSPMARTDAQMIFDEGKNRLLIYGGWNKELDQFTNDLWAYRFAKKKWKRLSPRKKRFYPPARRHFGAALDTGNNYWVIFGGRSAGGPVNDIWAFDLTDDIWRNLTPGPPPRMDHHFSYDPVSGKLFLYGGDRHLLNQPQKLHDVWEIKIERPQANPE